MGIGGVIPTSVQLKLNNQAPLSSAGGGSNNFNLFDEKSGPYINNINNELDMDSADNLSSANINHSTLSP
jgi:hypothetical protein